MTRAAHCLAVASILSLGLSLSRRAEGQTSGACGADRMWSTLVGGGLGAAAGAIPSTIVHRYDQPKSRRILAVSISAGAVIGFVAASRDHPCVAHRDSSVVADSVIAKRSSHAGRGALTGMLVGSLVGAVAGNTLVNVGCDESGRCNAGLARVQLTLFSAGGGAMAGGILGGLIGWALPAGRR